MAKRITPACAGKTRRRLETVALGGDHPRVCGENCPAWKERLLKMGSPPRVRGKLQQGGGVSHQAGITPACAGKTIMFLYLAIFSGDHPRVCGENWSRERPSWRRRGSPPRVRGKPFPDAETGRDERITPACAGKTSLKLIALPLSEDHPRVCGENQLELSLLPQAQGSPPRVRGKLSHVRSPSLNIRITPACAGKTSHRSLFFTSSPDHPRVCGEN